MIRDRREIGLALGTLGERWSERVLLPGFFFRGWISMGSRRFGGDDGLAAGLEYVAHRGRSSTSTNLARSRRPIRKCYAKQRIRAIPGRTETTQGSQSINGVGLRRLPSAFYKRK